MHKASISFTHRIIEYLNSIADRYALAVSSRKTAVKLVTGPLSLPERPPPCRAISYGTAYSSSPPLAAINPWKVLQEYFVGCCHPWEQVDDTFSAKRCRPCTIAGLCHLNFVVNLPPPVFLRNTFGADVLEVITVRISIIEYIYPPRLFSRAAIISDCVNSILLFLALFRLMELSYVEPLLKADTRASDNGRCK